MMPLGTGNDLSRTFRWGYGFKSRMLKGRFLEKVRTSRPVQLDRWLISVMPYEPLNDDAAIRETHLPPTFTIHHYRTGALDGSSRRPVQRATVMREGDTYTDKLNQQATSLYEEEGPPTEIARKASDTRIVRDEAAQAVALAEKLAAGGTNGDGNNMQEAVKEAVVKAEEAIMAPFLPSETVLVKYDVWESYDGVFCNYFSLGVDAVAAAAFHEHREAHPEKFTSRLTNQLWYVKKGFPAAGGCCKAPPPTLRSFVEIKVLYRGSSEFQTVPLGRKLRGLIVLNLQSYGGGRDLWGGGENECLPTSVFDHPSYNDGMLEIVGVSNIYKMGCIMGLNKVGVHARKLAQAQEIIIKIKGDVHMQIDGEPWKQAATTVHIKRYGQSTCLIPRKHAPKASEDHHGHAFGQHTPV
eukprot:TRINITY_DN3606_c0_g1_i2.p1 TRINITY_DN3606_c0_g1~~TRINITY_DN3606_c0_g1_i2.p1  ORF type:complete len:410 (-),score=100.93 TRINITY_DN3606_c0_g1_i2:668-1897(-)